MFQTIDGLGDREININPYKNISEAISEEKINKNKNYNNIK